MKTTRGMFVLAASVALLALSAESFAQPNALPAVQRPVAQQLNFHPVQISPELKLAIAKKPKYDQSKLKVAMVGAKPELTLASAKTVILEPVTNEPPPPSGLGITKLSPGMAQHLAYVESPWIAQLRNPKITFDVQWSNQSKQTPVKDQGPRGTCTAFASTAGLEAMGKRNGVTRDLSENEAFNFFLGGGACSMQSSYTTWMTGQQLTSHSLCNESQFPYTPNNCPGATPAACTSASNAHFTSLEYFFTPTFGGQGSLRADNTNLLETYIKAGHDIVYGLNVAGSDWNTGADTIDVQVDSGGNPAPSVGGHAMLLVGYNHTQNYFIVKNSWGTGWGHDGYAHISYEYIQTYGKYGYAVMGASVP